MNIEEIKIVGFHKDGYLMLYINCKELKKKEAICVIHNSNVYKAINNNFKEIKYIPNTETIFMVDINKPYMHIDEFLRAPVLTPIDITGIQITDLNVFSEYDTGILTSFIKKRNILRNNSKTIMYTTTLIDNIMNIGEIYNFFIKACEFKFGENMQLKDFKVVDILNPEFALLNKDDETYIVVDISEHCDTESIALAIPVNMIKEYKLKNVADLFNECSIDLYTSFDKFTTSSKYRERIVELKYEDGFYFILLNEDYDKTDAMLFHNTNRPITILQKLASLQCGKNIKIINFNL